MSGRIFVTGASGFVGTAIIDELSSRGYGVNALVNRRKLNGAAQPVEGSIFDPASLDAGMRGCEAVIHLVGIIMENRGKGITFDRIHRVGTQNVVEAAKRAGIRRYVHMSALGARSGAASEYHKTKFAAEQYVMQSGLDWTIFRPSLIHGVRGEFMQMEAKWARMTAPPFFFMPYFGAGPFGCRGAGKLQPVFVGDVAKAFVDSLDKPKTIGEIYPLAGRDPISWPAMHKLVSKKIVGRERMVLAMPVWKAKLLASVLPNRLLGFNRDQVIMSQEDNTCDLTKFTDGFGWTPRGFDESLSEYASRL
jgi:NADH dehydrogenase